MEIIRTFAHKLKKKEVGLSENQRKVLETVRKKGVVAISDIVENSTLSTATGSRLISKLISEQFLEQVDNNQDSLGKGRPQKYVKWYGKGYYTISIDIATTKIKGGVMGLDGVFYKEIEVENNPQNPVETCFEKINQVIEGLYNNGIIAKEKILGIGIAFAGLIDKNTGVIHFSPAFDWHDINPYKFLSNKTGLPIYIDNVTRLMALGEVYLGHGRQYSNFVFINLGVGIGSSIVIDGEIYQGTNGYSGEFGHVLTKPNSMFECSCGQKGCLTTTSSGEFIAKRAIKRLEKGEESTLKEHPIEEITAKTIFEEAEKGDALSISVIDIALSHLAYRVMDYDRIFDPEIIIMGGGLTQSDDYFFSRLNKKINALTMKHQKIDKVKIIPRTFRHKATMIGAGILVAKKVLNI